MYHGAGVRRGGGAAHHFQHLELFIAAGVIHNHLEEEAVQLGFRQLVGAFLLDGVLRGQHEEGIGQGIAALAQGHLALLHGFQQGALHLGRCAVDFVCQNQVGKHRALLGRELALLRVINHGAQQVGGQQVRRELNA